ncbi:MAG: DUF1127 domain-containing protein [Reyranellales bacterium]
MQCALRLHVVAVPERPSLVTTLRLWRARSRTRHQLATLEARELADVGLSHADQARECAKRFWEP